MKTSWLLVTMLSSFIFSCALPPLEGEQKTLTAEKKEAESLSTEPVKINKEAIPDFRKAQETAAPGEIPVISPVESVPEQNLTTTEKTTPVNTPERKFKLRTPSMIDDLPSEAEVENRAGFTRTIDDTVEEAATIRATE